MFIYIYIHIYRVYRDFDAEFSRKTNRFSSALHFMNALLVKSNTWRLKAGVSKWDKKRDRKVNWLSVLVFLLDGLQFIGNSNFWVVDYIQTTQIVCVLSIQFFFISFFFECVFRLWVTRVLLFRKRPKMLEIVVFNAQWSSLLYPLHSTWFFRPTSNRIVAVADDESFLFCV